MKKTRTQVLVATSVIIDAPSDLDAAHKLIDKITRKLDDAVESVCRNARNVRNTNSYRIHWLEDDDENAALCSKCERWTSDRGMPNLVAALLGGEKVDGHLMCDECRTFGDEERSYVHEDE